MRIIIVGEYMWPWYQEAFEKALEKIGHECESVSWFDKFWVKQNNNEIKSKGLFHKIQYRFLEGPIINKINNQLINKVNDFKPDIIFFYNCQVISNGTLKKIKKNKSIKLCQFTNDDPFSLRKTRGIWRKFISNIKHMHYHYIFRESNRDDFLANGASNVKLLMPYFIPEKDYPEKINKIPEHYKSDIVFAGHYENDGRLEMLEHIIKCGFNLKLYGSGWNNAIKKSNSPLKNLMPINPVVGDEYRFAINGAKLCLCFLSKINNDKYTRRSFEIPAMKKILLSEYTDEMNSIFEQDIEAIYFNNKEELLSKIKVLINDKKLRTRIEKNAYRKSYEGGHDITSRAKEFLNFIHEN